MFPLFQANTAEELWPQLLKGLRDARVDLLQENKEATAGRGGRVVELPNAVLHLREPRQRWAYGREPALNPAFALAEVIWILAGRQDSAFLNHWNPALPSFAGEGETYGGAYGWRLRTEHGVDQLRRAYDTLRQAPESRQVVLQIWKPSLDMPMEDGAPASPDVPCNVCSMMKVRKGQLHWTQIMRSNDVILGLPHNLIQWTTLQEIMAGWLSLEVGSYTHLSDSLHIYEKHWSHLEEQAPSESARHPPTNEDRLALPYEEFHAVFSEVEQRANAMRDPVLDKERLKQLADFGDGPPAYQNMLLVLAADTARRRSWFAEAEAMIDQCSNAAFRFMWQRWATRKCLPLVEYQ